MNKQQLIEAVQLNIDGQPAATLAVEAVLDAITRELAAGGSVAVTGFGTLKATKAAARTVRNPQTGEPITVPARTRVRFIPGQNLVDLVNGDKVVPVDGSAIAKAPKGSLTGGAR